MLPAQLVHQREWWLGVAEEFAHGLVVETVQAPELVGMDAAGQEHAIDPHGIGAGQIGADGIADRQHPAGGVPAQLVGDAQRPVIDWPVRLAVEDHLAAERTIEFGDGAGAINQAVAAFDDDVRVGADQRQLARKRLLQHVTVIVRGFGFVVERAGADDVIRLLQRREADIDVPEDRIVALRADLVDRLAMMPGDEMPGEIARRDDGVVGGIGDAELAQLSLHRVRRPWRIGDHDHGAALVAKGLQCGAGVRKRDEAVMDHAPDIAEHDIDVAREFVQMVDESDGCHIG